MKPSNHTIVKTEVTLFGVTISLWNGVTVYLNSNKDHIHLSFSGTELPVKVTPFAHSGNDLPSLEIANYVDIVYKPTKEE
jgi:hypothetical protein